MHALLADFSRAVRAERGDGNRDVWLALAVLHKRAYSSARALEQTVARRLAALEPEQETAAQLELPLDDQGEADAEDEAPRWWPAIDLHDRALERRLLTNLAAAAGAAANRETKFSALSRLLDRLDEPVIVFTEYRDTLVHVARSLERPAAILHGGLTRQERAAALQAFAAGGRAILLATDAAGEGLNLQRTCRIVVNLELPTPAGSPLGGHVVQGHVDATGTLIELKPLTADTMTTDYRLRFSVPDSLTRYVVEKGSITVEGISLTVAAVNRNEVEIAIIPHTFAETNLRTLKPGDGLNIEVDVLGKYAERQGHAEAESFTITEQYLIANGY